MLKTSAGNRSRKDQKMNAQIKELTEQLPVASDVQKSIANRLESALTENGYADLFARIFAIGAEIGVDNKKPATEKTKRENWHDADSVEAKTILATKSPKKPRKTKSVESDAVNTQELIDAFMRAIASR